MSENEKLLSYYDVLLRKMDAALLTGNHWLNDQIIAFYFEYLSRERLQGNSDVLLVAGATTYLLLSAGPDIAPVILDPLNFTQKRLVLFAVNNNPDVTAASGGSHWSLLAYTPADKTLHHYDSCEPMNRSAASQLSSALKPMLAQGTQLIEERCPQQENDFDCGMYVVAIAGSLCRKFNTAQGESTVDFRIDPEDVNVGALRQMRSDMHALIMKKVEEQKG